MVGHVVITTIMSGTCQLFAFGESLQFVERCDTLNYTIAAFWISDIFHPKNNLNSHKVLKHSCNFCARKDGLRRCLYQLQSLRWCLYQLQKNVCTSFMALRGWCTCGRPKRALRLARAGGRYLYARPRAPLGGGASQSPRRHHWTPAALAVAPGANINYSCSGESSCCSGN